MSSQSLTLRPANMLYNVLDCFDSLLHMYSSVYVQICFLVQG